MQQSKNFRFRRSLQCWQKTEAGKAVMTRLGQQALMFGCYDYAGGGGG